MDFSDLLTAHHTRVNQALQRFIAPLPFQNSPLVNAMEYGALLGGKRLRPFLVYATGEMLGADDAALDAPAAAVECIHAYSLIHDDLPAMAGMMTACAVANRPATLSLARIRRSWPAMLCKRWPFQFWPIHRCQA